MDLDTILEKWSYAKQQKVKHEQECDTYKGAVERYMKKKNSNVLKGKTFNVTKRTVTRQQLSKQNVPKDIWHMYATRVTYTSYHLKEN